MEAIAAALKSYRNKEKLKDAELARRLGVSKPTLSKYLNCKQLIGGSPLSRAFTALGITITYQDKEISARDFTGSPKAQPPRAEQVSFVFDQPCLFEETPENVEVTIERKQPQQAEVVVHVKVAS
jgi:transcriptional regulator with XRE-family HTH domain